MRALPIAPVPAERRRHASSRLGLACSSSAGEISGLSRSVSNLGSSFATAIAGTILVSDLASGNTSYVLAMVALAVLALVGLAAAIRLPASRGPDRAVGGLGATPAPGTPTERG